MNSNVVELRTMRKSPTPEKGSKKIGLKNALGGTFRGRRESRTEKGIAVSYENPENRNEKNDSTRGKKRSKTGGFLEERVEGTTTLYEAQR